MPSLISKILHRKSPSSSKSTAGSPSSPGSPSRRENPLAASSPGSPSALSSSAPTSVPASPADIDSRPRNGLYTPKGATHPEGRASLDQGYDATSGYPTNASGRVDTASGGAYNAVEARQGMDDTGHNAPFADESDRPQLPTTSSNVYNEPPSSDAPVNKALPSLPEVRSRDVADPALTSYPQPPSENPSDPQYRTSPMPHVMDVDRSKIQQDEAHRPKPVPAASATLSAATADNEGGRFPHVQSTSGMQGGALSDRAPQLDLPDFTDGQILLDDSSDLGVMGSDRKDIPARGASLRQERSKPDTDDFPSTGVDPSDSVNFNPIDDLRSTHDPTVTSAGHLDHYLAKLSVSTVAPDYPEASIDATTNTAALQAQRGELVERVAEQARARKAEREPLSAEGEQVFQRAGLGDFANTQGSVEVMTNFMKPVVQEHIVRQELTEITTIIDRDIHKYHIYPKIQPIADPDPTLLPVRHRIFSQRDGRWHEVVGDAAAIEILGEEAFRNGQQERREVRKLARPWPSTDGTTAGEATLNTADTAGDTEEDHVARGGRIIEREGVLGGQMGQWHQIAGSGPDDNGLDGEMGWDGLSGLGKAVKTVGVAI